MARTSRQVLEELIAKYTPVVRDAFLTAIAEVTSEVILSDLVKALEAGDVEAAFRTLGMSDAALRPISAALEIAYEAGGSGVGSTFPRRLRTEYGRGAFHFDVRNPRAENWIKEQSSRLITRIQEDARVNIRNVLTSNLEQGNNPRTTALDIVGRINPVTGRREGGIIGLTQQQELWVRNARRDLQNLDSRYFDRLARDKRFDSVVQKAIAEGRPLTADVIEKLVSRYKDTLLKLRGETIGRTETIQALNRSEYEAFKQAVDMGAARAGDVKREWDSAGDLRVRDSHRHMDGQSVGLEEPFTTPSGEKLMFPGDWSLGASAEEIINCRCRVRLNVDWLADID